MTTLVLPLPMLAKGRFASLEAYTDEALFDACGVRIAFTTRTGGVSTGVYDSLNLGSHVDDDLALVQANRARVVQALARPNTPLVVPRQVHGDTVLTIEAAHQVEAVQSRADEGADAVVVGTPGVAALLCFADCVPVIAVLPTGRFAVIHAGWRGVENCITAKAIRLMAEQEVAEQKAKGSVSEQGVAGQGTTGQDVVERRAIQQGTWSYEELLDGCNVYFGPHIHKECFETGAEVHQRFVDRFGQGCAFDQSHIDLSEALRVQLAELGVDARRVCDLNKCTVCCNDEFFSYRAQEGVAGRHGAFAVRQEI